MARGRSESSDPPVRGRERPVYGSRDREAPDPETSSYGLTQACWPVFEFVIHFKRQVRYGGLANSDQIRFEARQAFRSAEEIARDDPSVERLWHEKAKAMMTYFVDYMMINTQWDGRETWLNNPLELDRDFLDHTETLGGEHFYNDCDEIQREYEQAERRDRRDKHELGELLSLYFTCLRLGFKGKYDGFPNELADYTRRLYSKLPGYSATRGKEMFPETYKHVEEVKVDYKLGVSLVIVLTCFLVVIGSWALASRLLWGSAVREIGESAAHFKKVESFTVAAPPAAEKKP